MLMRISHLKIFSFRLDKFIPCFIIFTSDLIIEIFKRMWGLHYSRNSCIFVNCKRNLCSVRAYSKDSISVERMVLYNLH